MSANMIILKLVETGALDVEDAQEILTALRKASSSTTLMLPVQGLKKIELDYEIIDPVIEH